MLIAALGGGGGVLQAKKLTPTHNRLLTQSRDGANIPQQAAAA